VGTLRREGSLFLRVSAMGWLFALSQAARAAEPMAVRITYKVEPAIPEVARMVAWSCPPAADFVAAVAERVRTAKIAAPGEASREYRVTLRSTGSGSGYAALLEFADSAGAPHSREISSGTCADAAQAMALVTALAIDADGTDEPSAAASAAPPDASVTPPAAAPPPAPAPPAKPPEVPTARVEPPRPPPSNGREPPASPPLFDLGLRATATTAKAPDVLLGAEAFFGIRDATDVWLAELGVAGERGAKSANGPGSARFSFVGGRLRACVLRLALGPSFDLRPCAVFEGGVLAAEGFIDNPATRTDAWLAAGPLARLTFRSGRVGLHLEGGPMFSITQNDYIFGTKEAPAATVHEVPLLGAYIAVGGALHIF
jgi:hypothetical protein